MEYERIANGIRPYRRWCTVAICLFCHLYMSFAYELVKGYKVGSNNTDQAEYVTLTDGVLAVKEKYGTSAIDRTPIVRVTLKHGNAIVKVAYIKVKITRNQVQPEPKYYPLAELI